MFGWMRDWVDGFKTREAYCFRCRCDMKIDKPRTVILSNGTETQQGVCVDCGTNLSKFKARA